MADMAEQSGVGEGYRRASPWPLFVAVGLAVAETGVFLGVVPVAVGGILLLGGSCAGIIREAGYASTPWRPLRAIGAGFLALGGALWLIRVTTWSVPALVEAVTTDGVALRGAAVVIGGGLLVVAGIAGRAWADGF